MVTITLPCPYCGSDARGARWACPQWETEGSCHACERRSRENATPNAYWDARREEILHASQERSSLRGLTRTFGVSRATVSTWIKKRSSASPLMDYLGGSRSRGRGLHHPGTG